MNMHKVATMTAAAVFGLFAADASAGTIAYEGFDYANQSSLIGATGGDGWTAGWTGAAATAKAETTGYTYTGLSSEGNRSILGNGTLTRTLNLSSVPSLTTNTGKLGKEGTTIWFSFMSRIGGWWPNSNVKIGLALTDDGAQQLSVGMEGANWALGTVLSEGPDQTAIIPGAGTNVELFVGKIQFGSTDSVVDIWANPDLSGAAPTGGTHITDATFQAFAFNGIQLLMDQTGATIRTDEIRIGTDFASVISTSVIPEPASAALLAMGGGLMMLRRRTR